ncbi:hypothetical protein NQ317_002451 [Molorchus minor]|uniref:Pyridoxal kinase n=1 Tax=Molorchus minor TaxID=1323400 RepID=A0ABQ9J9T1_9CUCU|nr:hypothetical protein NQ317_002451 [Molorchus minor]
MGDNGKLYVNEGLVPIYRQEIIPLATIITPNLFEAELLAEMKITNVDDVWKAISLLHAKGCETVVISSVEFQNEPGMNIFASKKKGDLREKLAMTIEKLPISFTGSGDLFAALFLSWMYRSNENLKESLEKTVASLQAVLKRTADYVKGKEINSTNKELKLIQSKVDIEKPKILCYASIVE